MWAPEGRGGVECDHDGDGRWLLDVEPPGRATTGLERRQLCFRARGICAPCAHILIFQFRSLPSHALFSFSSLAAHPTPLSTSMR